MPYNTPGAFVYGTGPSNDPKDELNGEDLGKSNRNGIIEESINGEYDNGQFELTLGFDEALKAARDNAFLFKTMAKEIAFQEGLILSLCRNLFPKEADQGCMSTLA